MTTQQKPNAPSQKGLSTDALFIIWLILFAILEVVLVTMILINACGTGRETQPPSNDGQTPPISTVAPQPSSPSGPVFAGGAIPVSPIGSAATVEENEALHSQYAVLINLENGQILAEKQADVTFSPASMTKVMTLIVACEQLKWDDLNRKIVITKELYDYSRAGLYKDSSLFGFDIGDEVTVRDLLYGIGMKSASDCVVPIVFDVCESEEAFVALMNQRAQAMGLKNTHFDNAIGYESTENYTTALEMAMIMSVAMQSDLIADILCTSAHSSQAYYYKNGVYTPFGINYYNTLHTQRVEFYETMTGKDFTLSTTKLDGGKTGYLTSSFLVCQASSKAGGGKYVVVLGDAKGSNVTNSCGMTMQDLKYLLDTYAK